MRVTIATSQEGGTPKRHALLAFYYLFLATGVVALGYAGYAVLDRYWFQGVETSKFDTVSAPAEVRAVEVAPISEGGVIGEIEVPSVRLKAIVVQGDSEKLLRRSVGHLP